MDFCNLKEKKKPDEGRNIYHNIQLTEMSVGCGHHHHDDSYWCGIVVREWQHR